MAMVCCVSPPVLYFSCYLYSPRSAQSCQLMKFSNVALPSVASSAFLSTLDTLHERFSSERRRMAWVRNRGLFSLRCMAPEDEKMTRRSPLDFPIEWERPRPGRRPDIFPQFSPMKTPLPQPLPADPPEEDEEEEKKKEEEQPEEEPEKPEEQSRMYFVSPISESELLQ